LVLNVLYLAIAALLALLTVATMGLALRTRLGRGIHRRFKPMWYGMAAPVLAGVAVLLATGFTAGTAIQFARLVGKPAPPAFTCTTPECTEPPITLPDVHRVTVSCAKISATRP
jgi:hypothetical protein